jgi:hypothetical protein
VLERAIEISCDVREVGCSPKSFWAIRSLDGKGMPCVDMAHHGGAIALQVNTKMTGVKWAVRRVRVLGKSAGLL